MEGILLLAGIAGSFAAISEQMGKEYGMTRKQLRVMLLFLMVGFFNFALNYNRYYTDETLLKRDQTAFKEMKILHVREQEKYIAYEGTADLPSGRRRILCRDYSENRSPLSVGTLARVSGELSLPEEARNPGCFNYRLHLKGKGIVYTVNAQAIRAHRISRRPTDVFRRKLQQRRNDFLDKFHHRPAVRGFLKGILFGDRGELEEETYREFTENGTAHILAVSGVKTQNLAIPLTRRTRINSAFMPLHIAKIYILKLCLDEEIIPRCRFPCSRGYFRKCIKWQKKQ